MTTAGLPMLKFLTDSSAEFVGIRLKVFQNALAASTSELSQNVGWGEEQWEQWKIGKQLPSISDMIALSERYDVTLDYIYRGDMSNLPDWMARRIYLIVASDTLLSPPKPTRSDRLRLITRWMTDQNHRFQKIQVQGGIIRDEKGVGLRFAYSPIGHTRWELANALPDDPIWRSHIIDLEKHMPFKDFSYNIKTRSGRWVRIRTSGQPLLENGHFIGYAGTGQYFGIDQISRRAA